MTLFLNIYNAFASISKTVGINKSNRDKKEKFVFYKIQKQYLQAEEQMNQENAWDADLHAKMILQQLENNQG